VGIAAIEIARVEGAFSIATTRTSKKKAELLALGADHVIATEEEDLAARVNEITAGKGVRIVFDPVAGKGIEALAAATASNGVIFIYGALSLEPTPFPLFSALAKHLTIKGYTLFEVVSDPALFAKAKQYVFEHLSSGAFKPRIDRTFPLAQIVEAHRYMESNAQIGKIVVTV
jgi:NADPH:quinone reductase-like Zn-dependent oxidoreductase